MSGRAGTMGRAGRCPAPPAGEEAGGAIGGRVGIGAPGVIMEAGGRGCIGGR